MSMASFKWTPEQRQITALGDKLVEDAVKVYMDADLKRSSLKSKSGRTS